MDFGAHLPLMDFGGHPFTLEHLVGYTKTAAQLGFAAVSVNDHMVFSVPWLDGPTALAAMIEHSGDMDLATTIALTVVRGPVAVAKTLGAIDRLSGGRLVVGLGPGSSPQDYEAVGIDFAERWPRSSTRRRRHCGPCGDAAAKHSSGASIRPRESVWIQGRRNRMDRRSGSGVGVLRPGCVGSRALADGWLASAYNTTPELFGTAWQGLRGLLVDGGKDPDVFPNALATMWCYITDDDAEADRILRERVAPTIHRPEETLRERLPIGPPELFAEKLSAFAARASNGSSFGPSPMSNTSSSSSGNEFDPSLPGIRHADTCQHIDLLRYAPMVNGIALQRHATSIWGRASSQRAPCGFNATVPSRTS